MRQDIEFNAEGTTLRGWLFTPDAGHRPFPTIVMAHGFSAVKEMYLDSFAGVFANAGLAALVFDNRNFGATTGDRSLGAGARLPACHHLCENAAGSRS